MVVSSETLGSSINGRPLEVLRFQAGATPAEGPLLFIGGVHGDEIEGVWLMEAAGDLWRSAYPGRKLDSLVFARVNPDGVATNRRWNARDIDLNRNLPSKDWTPEITNPRYPPGPSPASEPENAALVKLIAGARPRAILSAHSFGKYQVNVNGPSREWGERLAALCGYPITEDIGYPTPGCLGTYSGKEMGIPTITLEIERGLPKDEVLRLHLPLVAESLRFWESR
jgi:protein MpaA